MTAGNANTTNLPTLDVLFSPAEFAALRDLDLSSTVCVVFDILRATSSMVTALNNGAKQILPVAGIPEAIALHTAHPDALLAGEREGLRILSDLTGSVAFTLGNSPREFEREVVSGRTIIMTTTNGTRALRACAHAKRILISSFLNLRATKDLLARETPSHLILVCSGTREEAAYEDALCAGALCDLLGTNLGANNMSDGALMARKLFRQEKADLLSAVSQSRNGRRLLSHPELREDVPFCLRRDVLMKVPQMNKDGQVSFPDE
jgi:2-phosphosulfolactate phosphatase